MLSLRVPCSVLLLVAATGCEPVLTRDVGVAGLLRGFVYDDYTYVGDYAVLEDASLEVRDSKGSSTGSVETYSDRPGYFEVTVEPGQQVELIVSAPGRLPTVRATTGPATLADFSPYVFPRAAEVIAPLLDELSEALGSADSTALLTGEAGAFWMEPLLPEDWQGAELTLTSNELTVDCIALTLFDDGAIALAEDGPLDRLVCPEVPPGRLSLTVTTAAGAPLTQDWTIQAGELVDATWFNLPQ